VSIEPPAPTVPTGINLDASGRLAKVCPEHRRVLERADSGEGLICPAGERGWHLVERPLSIDRHTGKEVEPLGQVVEAHRPEEDLSVLKPKPKQDDQPSNKCPGCGRGKVGRNARDGRPCAACRAKEVAPPRAAGAAKLVAQPRAAAAAVRKRATLERARFEDQRRALCLFLVQRPVPKSGGDAFLVRWTVAFRNGPGRRPKPLKGIAGSAATEELAQKLWRQLLLKAENDRWTKVELKAPGPRQLAIEPFPPAMGRPPRRVA
jgi:hypothetical protein